MSEPDATQPPERNIRLARLSGKATASWLIFFFLLIALLIPGVIRLPLWLDFEIVLAVWWVVWLAVLTRLLYTGQRVAADHQLGAPRNWFSTTTPAPNPKKDRLDIRKPNSSQTGWGGWGNIGFGVGDAEGCFYVLAFIVAVIVLVALIWFLVEIAIPVLFFLLYLVVRGMLAHVINDRHRCRGSIGRAVTWGLVWSTFYTVPLTGVVWFVHYILSLQAA
jgi:hypothetical protein